MELASMLAGERWSDRPMSVCPVIGAILRMYNDNVGDAQRDDLYRYAAEAVGTRGAFELQIRRARLALQWAQARRKGRRRQGRAMPEADAGPDLIAAYVIGSIGRRRRHRYRCRVDAHDSMLSLIDELIALGRWDLPLPPSPGEQTVAGTPPIAPAAVQLSPASLALA
jgi:hypothetical protein